MKNNFLWGVDLGGTKIEIVVLESQDNPKVIIRERKNYDRNCGYDNLLSEIKSLINKVSAKIGHAPASIGIGCQGSYDENYIHKNSNTVFMNGRTFFLDLREKLKIPVFMANDANCFALAEYKMGACKDLKFRGESFFGVIMGTGVGGGLIINSSIVKGLHGIGGEWGHNFLDESGGKCYCGKTGCVETILSGPALENYYFDLSGEKKSLKEIYKCSVQGEHYAILTINRLIEFFGKAIAAVINIVDPFAVVLGGGVSNIESLYDKGIKEVEKYVFSNNFQTKILPPKLGDSAGVFGAAFLNV